MNKKNNINCKNCTHYMMCVRNSRLNTPDCEDYISIFYAVKRWTGVKDKLYFVGGNGKITEHPVHEITLYDKGWSARVLIHGTVYRYSSYFGSRYLFSTREEAERTLKERNEE